VAESLPRFPGEVTDLPSEVSPGPFSSGRWGLFFFRASGFLSLLIGFPLLSTPFEEDVPSFRACRLHLEERFSYESRETIWLLLDRAPGSRFWFVKPSASIPPRNRSSFSRLFIAGGYLYSGASLAVITLLSRVQLGLSIFSSDFF